MGCPNAVSMKRLPKGSLAALATVQRTQHGARAATAGPCCSCQRDSSLLANCWPCLKIKPPALTDPGAHGNERGQSTMNRTGASKLEANEWGQELMKAVGMAGKDGKAGITQPAEQATAGGHSRQTLRPAQASRNKQPAVGRPCSKNNGRRRSRPAFCRAVRRGGVQSCWQPERRVQTCLTVLPHLSPLPVTVPTHSLNLAKPNFAPN